jgi:hypothetical protein
VVVERGGEKRGDPVIKSLEKDVIGVGVEADAEVEGISDDDDS